MSEIDNGGQAFPASFTSSFEPRKTVFITGMTLRQWYAGMALQGMLSDPSPSSRGCAEAVASNLATGRDSLTFTEIITKAAYDYADAMLRAGKGGK